MDDLPAIHDDRVYTVSEVTDRVSHLLGEDPVLRDVRVEGEISNYTHHSSGHMYFNLKDDDSVLGCVMFRRDNKRLEFTPEEGARVVAEGRVGVYAERGEYQLYVDVMREAGRGELYERFLELKEKLDGEGLFDRERKKELPSYPSRVGVVTSDSGAALQDIRDVLRRRYPVHVVLSPARVQGEGAAEEVAEALGRVDGLCDVVIVGRGGGSIEDLWAFNMEVVARAVSECETPVVSAVGHEVDTTIADLVADRRAATPSEAAELVVPDASQLLRRLDGYRSSLDSGVRRLVDAHTQSLDRFERVLERQPVIMDYGDRLDRLEEDLDVEVERVVERKQDRLREASGLLESLSPLEVLSRGYSVVESDGDVVRSVGDVERGDPLDVRVRDGRIRGGVEDTERSG